eukprot:XP_011661515.1 PREDICTED: basic salivary proline-rich protein 2-like [Strongylocentrotus purpuratus]
MIYSLAYLIWWITQYLAIKTLQAYNPFGINYSAIFAGYIINFLILSLLFVACIILLVGVTKDNKVLLLPYVILLGLLLFFQLISWIIWLAVLGFAAILLIIDFLFWIGFTSLNIVCLLCVISQYQELHEGRGRISDIMAARSARVVVIQPWAAPVGVITTTTYGGNTTVVGALGQQGYPPPQQGYPPTQQGYPPPQQAGQQGYPPPQQGYPPPQQAGQQGYPPPPPTQQQQQEGYPPAGQIPGQPAEPAPSYSQQDPAQQQNQSYPTK